jgi:hypothetical protein
MNVRRLLFRLSGFALVLSILGLFIWAFVAYGRQFVPTDSALAESHKKADLAVANGRALGQRNLNDLTLLFFDRPAETAACYQAALSNYVEDQWNRIARETGCDSNEVFCSKTNYFLDSLANAFGYSWAKKFNYGSDDINAEMSFVIKMYKLLGSTETPENIRHRFVSLSNTWPVAAKIFPYIRSVDSGLVPKDALDVFAIPQAGKPNPLQAEDTDPAILQTRSDELDRYVASCNARQPLAWSVVGDDLSQLSPTQAAIKLGVYGLLVKYVVGHQVPENKQGYIGCLLTLNQSRDGRILAACKDDKKCIEAPQGDKKEDLMLQLDELRAHQCSISYALQMTGPRTVSEPR